MNSGFAYDWKLKETATSAPELMNVQVAGRFSKH
jgi:hypothetical protein